MIKLIVTNTDLKKNEVVFIFCLGFFITFKINLESQLSLLCVHVS